MIFQLKGIHEVNQRLNQVIQQLDQQERQWAVDASLEWRDKVRQVLSGVYIVPRTGNLRNSVLRNGPQVSTNPVMIKFYTQDARYASFVEEGTSKMAPRPFALPAMVEVVNKFKALYVKYILKAWGK